MHLLILVATQKGISMLWYQRFWHACQDKFLCDCDSNFPKVGYSNIVTSGQCILDYNDKTQYIYLRIDRNPKPLDYATLVTQS